MILTVNFKLRESIIQHRTFTEAPKFWLTFAIDDLCYIHNLDDPEVILYPEYATACGRDCYTADCGIGPNDKVNLGLRPSDEVASGDENNDDLSV